MMVIKKLLNLPSPPNLSVMWNFGSLLGMALVVQIVSGLLLSMHYVPHSDMAFSSLSHVKMDVIYGWLIQGIHGSGASFFFMCMYVHVGRGIYYSSYKLVHVWFSGIVMMLVLMGTAFVGYVLPWGQMSFWGATVITNMLTAVPYLGDYILIWVWGGFSVGSPTLQRFFVLHFCLPFVLAGMSVVHIFFLHETGSSNPLGVKVMSDMQTFHPLYTSKDLVGVVVYLVFLLLIVCLSPTLFADAANYIPANPLVTPTHIQPEWYFLWAYAILRSIPNKLGGVCAMLGAIFILGVLPFLHLRPVWGHAFSLVAQCLFWGFISNFLLLTWIGSQPVEPPYIFLGQVFSVLHFSFFILDPVVLNFMVRFQSSL